MSDPMKGTASAPVTVIEYFDPMCPHCKSLAPLMDQVIAEKSDVARFVYKPVVLLGQRSVAPVAALHHAAREDKFFGMLDLIFANQKPSGYSIQELRQYAQQLDMSPQVLENRLRGGIYSPTMKGQREEFISNGFSSVPTVMINGRVVKSSSRSIECFTSLIDQAAANAN
jgi:protein-disulfide isomerase